MGELNRRQLLATGLAATGVACAGQTRANPGGGKGDSWPVNYCLNTSTIRGQNLTLIEEVEIAAKAGYDSIEPWLRKIDEYVEQGGSLSDLKKRIDDLGLTVESAIGFAQWIVDDDEARKKGLEQAKRDMEKVAAIGGKRLAAPPTGATKQSDLNLFRAAERYRVLLELGDQIGVVPQVEVWGFSQSLSRLGESVFVALESGHPKACLLPDVYHIYKGGSDFAGLNLLSGECIQVFHMNDYPADPPRETINDAARVYPGDGIAPLTAILQSLRRNGFNGALSLELFNPDYWKQDPLFVAKTGLQKMRQAVAKAGM